MSQNPDYITCFMLYYGRKEVAEESVESFLRQTYPHRRLVIVNTHPDPVRFEKAYPNIGVYNLKPDTFKNLNEKYNFALSRVKTKWFASWDSDDIWLPWHLENLVANIQNVKQTDLPMKIGYPLSLYALDDKIKKLGWQMWGDCIFEVNGQGVFQCDDTKMTNCDRQTVYMNKWNRYWLRIKDYPTPSFIFRRYSDTENASAWLGEAGQKHVKKLFDAQVKISTKEPFRPHWNHDYAQDAKDFMKFLKEVHYNTNFILKNPRKAGEVLKQ